jgi:IS30 family transposase
MPKTYTRLTEGERYQIYEGVTDKRSHRVIAALISKHHSTVTREVTRNKGLRRYRPMQTQEKAQQKHQNKLRFRKLTEEVQVSLTQK